MLSSSSILYRNAKVWQWIDTEKFDGNTFEGDLIINKSTGYIDQVILTKNDNKIELNYDNYDEIYDLNGLLVLPGLSDSHIHVLLLGESTHFVDLSQCTSMDNLIDTIQKHINTHLDLDWVQGVSWDQMKLGRYPTSNDLDRIMTDKPVSISYD